jgi:cytochrome b pre-mRNA-processing protein 3
MRLASIFQRFRRRGAVLSVYRRVVERAREPLFFAEWGVPDTLDGRFETLSLHAFLVFNRLKADPAATEVFAQDLFDTMFADLDRGLRERHVKAMARGLYGRLSAYERGLKEGDAALEDALRRNLYGTARPEPAQLTTAQLYLRRQVTALQKVPVSVFLEGDVPFAEITGDGHSVMGR